MQPMWINLISLKQPEEKCCLKWLMPRVPCKQREYESLQSDNPKDTHKTTLGEEKWKTITRQQEQLNSLLNPEMCWPAIRIQLGARMPKAIEGRPKGEAGWRRSLQKLFPSIRSTHLCPFNSLFIYSKQAAVRSAKHCAAAFLRPSSEMSKAQRQ